ncbi:MAG: extradiol ring-cleavage dioxygenase [Acidimicrobiia bacterium]|nr:extradiol ring-cleavage dioxygenase [Acidimicrobiia bacterium]
MADLVLGVGASHSPMVSMDGDDWLVWGEGDHDHAMLYTRDGRNVTYDEQLAAVGDTVSALASSERCREGADRVAAAMVRLQQAVAEARLDVLVIIGDDQDEHLLSDNLPPFLIYWGDTLTNAGIEGLAAVPPVVQRFLPGYKEPDGAVPYPVATDLARHLIAVAFDSHFDVATSDRLPEPARGMGHAFGFPMRRLASAGVSIVPIMVNTYNPPSQPRASRCRDFGTMIRTAIDSFAGEQRVAVVASGGLSHFLVLEDLDREVLDGLSRHDLDALCAIPEATYVAGTSEIKNWITTAAACHDLDFELIDYVPGYRTPAGSGTGLAFALWTP